VKPVEISRRFLATKSGLGLLLHLALCAALSAAIGCGFYYSSLSWFKAHKSEEKVTALQLVDAFVTNYSAVRSKLGGDAPVPATFRAHSIELFDGMRGSDADFRLRWVGRKGRAIKTPPADAEMAAAIERFAATPNPKPESEFVTVGGQLEFRTLYPSVAHEQSCIDCHNALQADIGWRLNDVMGAFAIDAPAAAFLQTILEQSVALSLGLFLALAAIGFVVAVLQFRHAVEREAAAAEIGRAEAFLHTIIENMPMMVTVKELPDERYVLFNKAAEGLLGIPREVAMGRRLQDLLPDGAADQLLVGDAEALQSGAVTIEAEQAVETSLGDTRILATKKLAIRGENGQPKYLLALCEDVTERKRIHYIAHHDALTDLPNRGAFLERLAALCERPLAAWAPFAVLFIDLDRFKEINDVYGHAGGDGLLRQLAARLQSACDGALLARFGGDEFAAILSEGEMPAAADALAGRLLATAAGDLEVDGRLLRVGLSIGVALFPGDGEGPSTLLGNADAALYRAKADGRGTVRFFDPVVDKPSRARRGLPPAA
jgi:diguanylate cyclase (GGDEF)-like protein/PAS domain S-box-containing protein